jgi:hypothetical protein
VVTPSGKQLPDGGTHTTLAIAQLSAVLGVAKLTVAQGLVVNGVTVVIFAGQVIVGACISLTVTVKEQFA